MPDLVSCRMRSTINGELLTTAARLLYMCHVIYQLLTNTFWKTKNTFYHDFMDVIGGIVGAL